MDKLISRKKYQLFGFTLICIIAAIWTNYMEKDSNPILAIIIPFDLLGRGLRSLSLMGSAGNVFAWAVYIVFSLIPLSIPVIRYKKKKKCIAGDILCLFTSIYTFLFLFLLINPGKIAVFFYPIDDGGEFLNVHKGILCIILFSLIVSAVVVYVLKDAEGQAVLKNIRHLVLILAYIGVFAICFLEVNNLLDALISNGQSNNLQAGLVSNSMLGDINDLGLGDSQLVNSNPISVEQFLAVAKYVSQLVSMIFLLRIVPLILKLLYNMEENYFSIENVSVSKKITGQTKTAILVLLFSSLGYNILQFLLASISRNIAINVDIPIGLLLVAFVMLFLIRYFSESMKVNDENQSFV